jgi:ABC-type nitrate/sulfonate/bicarbonate transport system ATPase subunit
LSRIRLEKHFQSNNQVIDFIRNKNIEIKEVSFNNINKRFNENPIFLSYSETFNSQQIRCLKAPSGRGKTTLLRLVSGLDQPDSGQIQTNEKYSFAYSFQDIRLLPWLSVEENIAFSIQHRNFSKNKFRI